MKLIDDLAASKLHERERELVRGAADALIFCEDLRADDHAEQALADLYELVDRLVDSDRLKSETGERLVEHVEACGPLTPVG